MAENLHWLALVKCSHTDREIGGSNPLSEKVNYLCVVGGLCAKEVFTFFFFIFIVCFIQP